MCFELQQCWQEHRCAWSIPLAAYCACLCLFVLVTNMQNRLHMLPFPPSSDRKMLILSSPPPPPLPSAGINLLNFRRQRFPPTGTLGVHLETVEFENKPAPLSDSHANYHPSLLDHHTSLISIGILAMNISQHKAFFSTMLLTGLINLLWEGTYGAVIYRRVTQWTIDTVFPVNVCTHWCTHRRKNMHI